ncbi:MAG: AAA family ATPase, partial [Candidatus Micrarchaeaceae archaeon]
MLYIDRVVLHNFKSFKHANISFKKNFNCIVGPNGSGKSNICDSLLFGLGESSMRRLRITSPALLLNEYVKNKKGAEMKRAYVKIIMKGASEVEIVRFVKEDRKMGYRLNGRRATKQEVIEFLKAHGGDVNETNTIAQGEITKLLSMNGKERRELIDIAAGISEFDKKREAAEKELEKVEIRLSEAQGVLNERKGFLNELKKEKEDAQKYIEISGLVKSLTLGILLAREKALLGEMDEENRRRNSALERKKELEKLILELNSDIEKLSAEKAELVGKLNKHSMETSAANSAIERIKGEIAVLSEKISSTRSELAKDKEYLSKLLSEKEEHLAKKESLDKEIEILKADIAELSKHAGSKMRLAYAELAELYAKKSAEIIGMEEEKSEVSRELAALASRKSAIEESLGQSKEEIIKMRKRLKSLEQERQEAEEQQKSALKAKESASSLEASLSSEIKKVEGEIGEINEESIKIREQMALHGGASQAIAAELAKGIGASFHGRAYELCTYDEKFSTAIMAASGNRLGYFVVDNSEAAAKAIDILKKKALGRASFIPIEEVVQYGNEKAVNGIKPLIDFIKFDKKYSKVFNFIFSNTFVVGSIQEAKAIGIGGRRYVTIEGDLIENTGVISGGKSRVAINPILLESRLASAKLKLSSLSERMSGLEQKRRDALAELAKAETALIRADDAIGRAKSAYSDLNAGIEKLEKLIASSEAELAAVSEKIMGMEAKRNELERKFALSKSEIEELQKRLGSDAGHREQKYEGKADAIRDTEQKLEKAKLREAEAAKERELIIERLQALSAEIEGFEKSIKSKKEAEKDLLAGQEVLVTEKEKMEKSISSNDSVAKELYSKVSECESKLSSLGFKVGSAKGEIDRIERSLIELSGKISQAEVRIGDIRAEKRNYDGVSPIEGSIEEMEQKLGSAKASLESLGSVNMKAPEMYEERMKEMAQAEEKLATISMERTSIIEMINEIESKKESVFAEVFESINSNFKRIYSYADMGEAELMLDN